MPINKTKKIALSIIAIIVLLSIISGILVLKTDTGNHVAMVITGMLVKHEKPYDGDADFTMNADELVNVFSANQVVATKKYSGKKILLTGKITAIDEKSISLNNAIVCTIDSAQQEKITAVKVNEDIKIQGRLVTYNDLLNEIDLDGCGIK